ncbi:MAG: HNH endonuclease signature motif containing protein [Nostoc sp.]
MNIVDEFFPEGWNLGKLCIREHDYKSTRMSLRNKKGICVECNKIYQKSYRESDKAKERSRCYQKFLTEKARSERRQRISQDEDKKKAVADIVPEGFHLGKICVNKHDYKNTGFTLRAKDGHCIECARAAKRRYKKSQKGRITENRYGKSSTGKAKYARYNQNKGKETKRAYVTKNLDWNRERSRRGTSVRRAKKAGNLSVSYSMEDVAILRFKFNLCCAYCGKATKCQLDHFVPICKGGADSINNLIPACSSCNFTKNAQDPETWYRQQIFFTQKRWDKILIHVKGDI